MSTALQPEQCRRRADHLLRPRRHDDRSAATRSPYTPQDTRPQPEGYSLDGWTAARQRSSICNEWHAAHPAAAAQAGRRWKVTRRRKATTTPPTTLPTSSTRSRRASTWSKMKSSATTPPSRATWQITLTSTARQPRGTRRRKASRAEPTQQEKRRYEPIITQDIFEDNRRDYRRRARRRS